MKELMIKLLLILMLTASAQAFDPANVKLCQKWHSEAIVVVSVNFPCPKGYSIVGMPSMPESES